MSGLSAQDRTHRHDQGPPSPHRLPSGDTRAGKGTTIDGQWPGAGAVDPVVLQTMTWSAEFAVRCVPPPAGAALRRLAASRPVRTAVELGTGLGVSGLWLLAGLPDGAALTSIDVDGDLQAMARQAFTAAGHPPGRFRLLTGRAEVLVDRLADAAYDLAFVDLDGARAQWVSAAARILRPGGRLLLHRPTADDRAALHTPQWRVNELDPDLLRRDLLMAAREPVGRAVGPGLQRAEEPHQ